MNKYSFLYPAYKQLEKYVKRVSFGSTFDTNKIREKVELDYPDQLGALISAAVRDGLIEKVSVTKSDNPTHKGGNVGVYTRA